VLRGDDLCSRGLVGVSKTGHRAHHRGVHKLLVVVVVVGFDSFRFSEAATVRGGVIA